MLSLPKHLYLNTISFKRITSEVKMLRQAQHDRSQHDRLLSLTVPSLTVPSMTASPA